MLIIIKYGCDNPGDCWKMEMAEECDTIVFLQDGVFWAITDKIDSYLQKNLDIVALEPDLNARGYSKEDSKVPVITYDNLVTIIENHPQSMG